MAPSLSDAQKVPLGTLEVALSSEPVSSLQKSEKEHRGGPRDSHGLVGGGAHAYCRTTGRDDGREREYGVFFFFPCLLGCFRTPTAGRLWYALITRLVVRPRVVDDLLEWSVRCTVVKPGRAEGEGRTPMGVEAVSAASSVVYGCSGLNMFEEANAVDHTGSVESGGSFSDSVLADCRAGGSVSNKSGLSVGDEVAEV